MDYELPPGTAPEQCGAILCSETYPQMFNAIRRLKLDHLLEPYVFPVELWEPAKHAADGIDLLRETYDRLCQTLSKPVKFLFVEGFQALQADGQVNDAKKVIKHYRELQSFCEDMRCTILGTCSTAKMKAGEGYALLAHKILGSGQWAQNADTLIGVAEMDTHLPLNRRSSFREISIQAPGSPQRVIYMDFDANGQLHAKERVDAQVNTADAQLDARLDLVAANFKFSRKDTLEWGAVLGISDRTVDRWRADRVDMGFIQKSGTTTNTVFWRTEIN